MALITYDAAKIHHHALGDEHDPDVQMKLEQATAIVINYLKRPNHGWTAATDPAEDYEFAIVQAAILKVFSNLFGYRGDEEKPAGGPLTEDVMRMLSMLRDPALA